MTTEEQIQNAYRHLKNRFLSNTKELLNSSLGIIKLLQKQNHHSKLLEYLKINSETIKKDGHLDFQYCEKISRTRNHDPKEQNSFKYSTLAFINKNQQIELIIIDRRPDQYTNNLIVATGGCKSYKAAIKIENAFTKDNSTTCRHVLLEICNKSQNGRRRHFTHTAQREDTDSISPILLMRYSEKNYPATPIAYKIHPIASLKFDVITIIQQLNITDPKNQLSTGSEKLHFFLLQTGMALSALHNSLQRAHGDVKLENFLVNRRGQISAIDESSDGMLKHEILHATPYLTPPEPKALNRSAADTFALSFCLLQFVFGHLLRGPSSGESEIRIFANLDMQFKQHMQNMSSIFQMKKPGTQILTTARSLQVQFLQRLTQDFSNLPCIIGERDQEMVNLLYILEEMLAIDPRTRLDLEDMIKTLSPRQSIPPKSLSTHGHRDDATSPASVSSSSTHSFFSRPHSLEQPHKKRKAVSTHHRLPTVSSENKKRQKFTAQQQAFRQCKIG